MTHTLTCLLLLLTQVATAQLAINPFTKDSTYNTRTFKDVKGVDEIAFHGYTFQRSQPAAFPVRGEHFNSKHGGISIFENEVIGVIFTDTGNINITANKEGKYRLINDRNLPSNPFMCYSDVDNEDHEHKETANKSSSGTCKVVGTWLIGDASLVRLRGSVANAEQFCTGFFNVVQALYAMHNIRVQISQLTIWTTNPFSMTQSSATSILTSFSNWSRTQTYTGNLASLVSLESGNRGGIAFLSGLCSNTANVNYSNIQNSWSNFPIYSWTTTTVAHEIGHNLSANHTHWCGWLHPDGTRRPIDLCYAVERYLSQPACYVGSVVRAGGTVMSYCHLNGTVNMTLGFGDIVANQIRNYINSATCITGQPLSAVNVAGDFRVCAGQTPQRIITGALAGATTTWTPTTAAIGLNTAVVSLNGCNVTKTMNIKQNAVVSSLNQNFEGLTALPANWDIVNPNENATFAISTLASARGIGTTSMRISNFSSPNSTGFSDTLFLPAVTQSGKRVVGIKLDYAYIKYGPTTFYLDTLELGILGNCNNKQIIRLFRAGGDALSTNPLRVASNFIPEPSEWRTLNYDLSVNNYTQAQLVIINKSGWGNPIFFDNIEFILGDVLSGCPTTSVPAQPAPIQGLSGVCAAGTQTYSVAAQLDATSYTWTVPSGSTIVAGQGTQSVTVGNTTAGNITVTAVNCRGNSTPRSLTISLVTTPPQPPPINGQVDVCYTGISLYDVPQQPNMTWNWTFVGGSYTITGQGTSQIVANWTIHGSEVRVQSQNACGISPVRSLLLNRIPRPVLTDLVGTTRACPGTNITYTALPLLDIHSYTWSFPTGWVVVSQTANSITVTPNTNAGNVSVFASPQSGLCNGVAGAPISTSVSIDCGVATCPTPTGLTSSNVTTSSATLAWSVVSGAVSYNLQWKLASSSTWTTVNGITANSFNLTGLSANTSYNYQVQSVCSATSSAFSTPATFTTTVLGGVCTLTDITLPTDVVTIVDGSRVDSRNPPLNEEPFRAIDNISTTKYLNFKGAGSGIIIDVPRTHQAVTSIALTSGNDEQPRDPASYRLEGWNGSAWVQFATGAVPVFASRRQRLTIEFSNTQTYSRYRITFPTIRGNASTTFFQISEIELLACINSQAIIAIPNPTDRFTTINGVKFDLSRLPAGVHVIKGVRVIKR